MVQAQQTSQKAAEAFRVLKCDACEGRVSKLSAGEISEMVTALDDRWCVVDEHHLVCNYTFPDFAEALAFTNRVGELAEAEGHHPDISLGWGRVEILLYTHSVDGLTKNDFILAAKISAL